VAMTAASDQGDYRRVPETVTRGFDFEMRSSGTDGRTLEGYVAMFGSVARIPDRGGDFDEELHPGFADRSLSAGYPVMQFDHGRDPRVGTVPIGVYDTFDKDARGYFVRGRLFDNPVVDPVRQAIAGKAIKGMSFRFSVRKPGGDRWNRRSRDGVDKRDILDADVHEAGPVVFPAYAQTSVTVRSLLASATEEDRAALIEELADAIRDAGDIHPYLTGQRDTWSVRGGDPDDESWEDEASTGTTSTEAVRALALLRPVLP
jgi:HK97 family phage prohead protease